MDHLMTSLKRAFLILTFGFCSPSFAKPSVVTDPLRATGEMQLMPIPSDLTLQLSIEPGYYAYIDQLKLKFKNQPNLMVVDYDLKPIHRFFDKHSNKSRFGIKGKATLKAPVMWTEMKGQPLVHQPVEISLTYQACSEEVCLYPKTIVIPVESNRWSLNFNSLF